MKASTIMGAIFGGMAGIIPARYKSERRAKNPNTPESQYLIGCAEEKRERKDATRKAISHRIEDLAKVIIMEGGQLKPSIFRSLGTGPYACTEYLAARADIRAKVDAHNAQYNPKGKPTVYRKDPEGTKPEKIAKNDVRKRTALLLSGAAIVRANQKFKKNGRLA